MFFVLFKKLFQIILNSPIAELRHPQTKQKIQLKEQSKYKNFLPIFLSLEFLKIEI